MAPLVDLASGILATSGERRFVAAFSAALLIAALLLLLTLVAIAWARSRRRSAGRQPTPGSHAETTLATPFWWLGLFLALASVAGLNLVVDPYGMYGSGVLAPISMQMRRLKAEAYAALTEAPQVVVLGSSVAHSISPRTLQERLGFTAFNAAVGSGRIDDFLIQAKFMLSAQDGHLPKVFFVQLAPDLPYGGKGTAELTPLPLLPFMRPTAALEAVTQRASRSIGRKQTGDSLYALLAPSSLRSQPTGREIDRHGGLIGAIAARRFEPLPQGKFNRRLGRYIRRARSIRRRGECLQLDPRALGDLDEFLRLTAGRGSTVVFYLSPTHPRFRREVELPSRLARACRNLLTSHMSGLAAADESVSFLDFSVLASIDGDASSAGYTDPFHLTLANGDRVVAAASDTLRAAMKRASANEREGDPE